MNLLEVFHQRWAAAADLEKRLPAARVFTGASFDLEPPLATVVKLSGRPESYHNDGSAIDTIVLRIRVLHQRHDDAAEIIQQIKKAFDRTAFDLSDGDTVLDSQRLDDAERQRDDGVWEMTIDLKFTVFLASGA